jgi:hypothetical protein
MKPQLQEIFDRTKRKYIAMYRVMTDEELRQAFVGASAFRRSVIMDEWRGRHERPMSAPKKSVYEWLRHPAL